MLKMSVQRRPFPWLAFAAAAAAATSLAVLSGCSTPSSAATSTSTAAGGASGTAATAVPDVRVQTAAVTSRPVPRYLAVTGQLESGRETDLAANANGRVTANLVERGSQVKAGDVLASLDVRAAALSAAEAKSQADTAAFSYGKLGTTSPTSTSRSWS